MKPRASHSEAATEAVQVDRYFNLNLIPVQSKSVEIFDDGVAKFRRAPGAIQILDSENELSTTPLSPFLGAPEGDGMANMKITRRRGRNATAIGNFRFQIGDFGLA